MAASDDPSRLETSVQADSSRMWGSPLVVVLTLGLSVGLAATLLYAVGKGDAWRVFGSGTMFAMASLAAGTLLGLLFGVPRSFGASANLADVGEGAASTRFIGIGANTNLEQISDWLTKIIVGVSLTQLASIKNGAAHLFRAIAPAMGGGSEAASSVVAWLSIFHYSALSSAGSMRDYASAPR